jgi:opacity protein-like surface antigen
MKKFSPIFIILLLISNISFAQFSTMSIGLNGTLSVPIGDFNDVAKMGYGLSGTFYYDLTDNFELTGALGYLSWGGDKLELTNSSSSSATGSFSTIPVMVGVKYIFNGETFLPYAAADIGLQVFSTPDQKVEINGVVLASQKGETNAYLGFGFGGGLLYELSDYIKLDGSLNYNIISADNSIGHFTVKLGFIVGIN